MGFYDSIRVGASGTGESYEVEKSLRFDNGSSAYLSRTAGSPTNQNKGTFSGWVKRTKNAHGTVIFGGGGGSQTNTNAEQLAYISSDTIASSYKGGLGGCSIGWYMYGTRKLRDLSAWMHICISFDWTQSGDSNRLKFYINGVQDTLNSCGNTGAGFQYVNVSGATQYMGRQDAGGGPYYSHHYLAEAYFIDGTVYTPSDFTETDSATGQLMPKDSSEVLDAITLGNNGGYYNFSDTSNLGKDHSSNSNDFTPNNFSVSAGAGNDSVEDTPTNNFPTFNPLDKSSDIVLYNGNLRYSFASRPNSRTVRTTFALPSTGKYYWEFLNEQASNNPGRISMGVVNFITESSSYNTNPNSDSSYMNYSYGGGISIAGSSIGVAGSWYNTERAAIAVDCDTGKFWFGKVASNGSTTWYNSTAGTDGNPATGANPTTTLTNPSQFMPFGGWHEGGSGSEFFSASINFGQQAFLGTPPTGYKKFNSTNLPDPTILLPNKHFDTLLYTGNNGTQNITGLNFDPDWVWAKNRQDAGYHHDLYDTVRGDNLRIFST